MLKKLITIIYISLLLPACSDKPEDKTTIKPANQVITDNNTQQQVQPDNLGRAKLKASKGLEPVKQQRNTMNINGEKFKLLQNTFAKDAMVVNLSMAETGRIKGTFVVVTHSKQQLNHHANTLIVSKIAKNTFRLVPQPSVNLSDYYQVLRADTSFSVVELEIDYSPVAPQQIK